MSGKCCVRVWAFFFLRETRRVPAYEEGVRAKPARGDLAEASPQESSISIPTSEGRETKCKRTLEVVSSFERSFLAASPRQFLYCMKLKRRRMVTNEPSQPILCNWRTEFPSFEPSVRRCTSQTLFSPSFGIKNPNHLYPFPLP
jgi:hypothetical protein